MLARVGGAQQGRINCLKLLIKEPGATLSLAVILKVVLNLTAVEKSGKLHADWRSWGGLGAGGSGRRLWKMRWGGGRGMV